MAGHHASEDSARRLLARLASIRREAKVLLIARRVAWVLAALLVAAAFVGVVDYAARLPQWARLILLVVLLSGLGWSLARLVWPAWRMRPTLIDMALRLEARREDLKGRLASAADLARAGKIDPRHGPLLDSLASGTLPDLMRRKPTAAAMASCLALVAGVWAYAFWQPQHAQLAALRVLAPWTSVQWPSRTAIEFAGLPRYHPLGEPLAIRGLLTRTDRAIGKTRVEAWYRLDGGSPQRVVLTSQGAPANPGAAEIYERLVNPAAEALRMSQHVAMELWIETADDRTPTTRIDLVRPPRVVQASATVSPPAYAAGASGARVLGLRQAGERLPVALGTEDTAVLGPILAGSSLELSLRFNTAARAEAALATSGEDDSDGDVAIEPMPDGQGIVARLRVDAPASLRVQLADELGIASTRPLVVAFEVVPDNDPTAAVIEPSQDEAVLSGARLSMVGEGRDDFGLSVVSLVAQRASPPQGSHGAPPEPVGDQLELARWQEGDASTDARAAAMVELSTLGLTAGDELHVRALATDLRGGEPVASATRRIRIISELELVEQLRAELAVVREAAKRLDRQQRDVLEEAARVGPSRQAQDDNELSRQQGDLSSQLTRQAQAVRDVAERAERNDLDDSAIDELVRLAQNHLDAAADQSERAQELLDAAARSDAPQERGASRDQAERAQERVRDELGGLVGLLSRDEDEWLARRDLERLIEQQRELRDQAARAQAQTAGQMPEELSADERSMIEQIAQRQAELARRAQDALDQLDERARALSERDPARAQTLQEAAERGRQGEAPREMERAAQEARQNRMASAQEHQQQALDALESVAERLDEAGQDRDRELRRVLAQLALAIEALIARQQTEIDRLLASRQVGSFDGLDGAMIALSRDTAALSAERAAGDQALGGIARKLLDAADAQDLAVVALRARPVDDAQALLRERESLELLQGALDEARTLEEQARQRELQRQRQALRRAYAQALSAQTTLRDETGTYSDQELSRRQQVLVRRLGDRQRRLLVELEAARQETEGLDEAAAFRLAHARIDRAGGVSAERLALSQADRPTLEAQDTVMLVLRSLIEALDSATQRGDQDFAQANQGGQQGGQGGQPGEDEGVVPPMAELLLLRTMQVEAAQMTRAIDDGMLDQARVAEAGRLQGELAEVAADLVRRINEQQRPQGPPAGGPPRWSLGFGILVAGFGSVSQEQDKPKDPPTEPTLDELLGLTEPGVSERPDTSDLDRELEGGVAGTFMRAVDLMDRAARRLNEGQGTGLATQRVQQEAIAALDQLIEAARRQQQQQQSQQNQQQQQQQQQQQAPQQQQQEEGQQQQQQDTTDPQGVQGQAQQGGSAGEQPAGGATWGALPPRVREALRQGSSDPYSAVYRAMTEAYYRRLAEEAGR